MLPELTQDEFSAALDAVAADVIGTLEGAMPPVDALVLAKALGLAVAWDPEQQGRGRVVRLRTFGSQAAQGSILLRPDPRQERLQWATAHEIGETCAVHVFDRLCVDPREAPPGTRETIANLLASRILLPRMCFARDAVDCGWDLLALKHRYVTASHELIARRMLDFAPPVAISVFDHGRRTWRRGNLPWRLPPLSDFEKSAFLAAHEQGVAIVEEGPGCTVQAWPIHEPEWKREILRTAWHDCDAE